MQLPNAQHVEIKYLSRVFDKMSECYKLFWFQAIVEGVIEGKQTMTFNELIHSMIANAWYMVAEYKLNLGPADTLESLIHYIFEKEQIKANAKKEEILSFLETYEEKEFIQKKRTLILNVPYRLQSSFIQNIKGREWDIAPGKLAKQINMERRLMYYFIATNGLESIIEVEKEWVDYFVKNQEIVRGWIQYNLLTYLQRRNPDVPGIINKINPPQERKLEKVKKYWKLITETEPIRDIYTGKRLNVKDISIDHFIPWSFVAHDELWNLHPTTKCVNSSKSNSLPLWDKYFPLLCETEYESYQILWKYEKIHRAFESCQREHVNSSEIRVKLYREGIEKREFSHQLEDLLLPLYQSARNAGFKDSWIYSGDIN